MTIRGVIFDKDGTLFDFQSTWGIWTAQVLARIAGSDEALLRQLAQALGYDTHTQRVQPGSVIVAATPDGNRGGDPQLYSGHGPRADL